jgi:tripartite motif-containing protein 71
MIRVVTRLQVIGPTTARLRVLFALVTTLCAAALCASVAFADERAAPSPPAPAGIAVDSDGNVFVSDYGLDRILKFAPDGSLLTQWGGSGSALGQFSSPFGVALDSSNTLYVADQLNNRVQRFASDGTALGAWGAPGAGANELRTPFGVAVGAGHVYIADFGNDRVQVYGMDGSLAGTLGAHGSGDGQFLRPAGVAVASDGTLFVSDHFNDRIERFGGDGRFVSQLPTTASGPVSGPLASFGPVATPTVLALAALPTVGTLTDTPTASATLPPATPTPAASLATTPVATLSASITATPTAAALADAQLRRPEGVSVDREGNLWVADYGRDRVVKLSPDGRLLSSLGNHGSGPGEFVGPKGVAIDPNSGRIYVADTGNARIQRLAPDGTPEAAWPLPQ